VEPDPRLGHAGAFLRIVWTDHGEAAEHDVLAARKLGQVLMRPQFVTGLADHLSLQHDVGVASDHEPARTGHLAGLQQGVREHHLGRVAVDDLLDPGDDDLEFDADALEDLAALRRTRGEDDRKAHGGYRAAGAATAASTSIRTALRARSTSGSAFTATLPHW